jgi:hypothetical protein
VNTVFGTVRFKRWLFQDRQTGEYVYLLDRMLQFEARRLQLERAGCPGGTADDHENEGNRSG